MGIVTTGDPEDLNIIDILKAPGRKFTLSYLEEKAALYKALAWLLENGDDPTRVALMCTESQSLCTALLGQNLQKFSVILNKLAQIQSTIHLQLIPGHSDVPGNEAADQRAKEAAENSEHLERPPISLEAAYSVINQKIKDVHPCHQRTRQIY